MAFQHKQSSVVEAEMNQKSLKKKKRVFNLGEHFKALKVSIFDRLEIQCGLAMMTVKTNNLLRKQGERR